MRFFLFLLLSCCGSTLFGQSLQPAWAYAITGLQQGLVYDFAMTIDSADSVIVAGAFEGKLEFDPGPDTFFLSSQWIQDVFIQKVDSDGNLLWAKSLGDSLPFSSWENISSVSTASDGSIYLTGDFNGTLDFDPGPGIFEMTSIGNDDLFVLKLSANGDFAWAKSLGTPQRDDGQQVEVGTKGNVFVYGEFSGTIDFDPGPDTVAITASTRDNAFILKLDANGDFLWVKTLGERTGVVVPYAAATDSAESFYLTGFFAGTADFDPGPDTVTLVSMPARRGNSGDIFILKLDADGNFEWASGLGSPQEEKGDDIEIDPFGNILVGGSFSDTVDFDPGPGVENMVASSTVNDFILKLENNGDFVWVRSLEGLLSKAYIATDSAGAVYVSDILRGTLDMDPGAGTFDLTPMGSIDVFMLKLGQDGTFDWAQSLGGTGGTFPLALEVGKRGDIFSMGEFFSTIIFDPILGINDLTSVANPDLFVVKFADRMLGLEDAQLPPQMIYPNPCRDMVNIDLSDLRGASVSVYSYDGKLVHQQENILTSSYQFELKGAPGLYIVEIQAGGKASRQKLIKSE